MQVLLFSLHMILLPIRDYIKTVYILTRIKYKNPTLKILRKVDVCRKSKFGNYVYLAENSKIINTFIDDYSYVGADTILHNTTTGKFSCIGPNVKVGLGEHPTKDFISVHPIFYSPAAQVGITFADISYFEEYKSTIIGSDVWIGANAIIRGGVTIGHGSIVGAGSVVTKDVLPYSIVGGIPAKIIKYRFTDHEITKLLSLKWWLKDASWLRKNYKCFHDIQNIDQII